MKLPCFADLAGLASVLALAFGAAGCAQHIGDKCVLSTDCSVTGDRVCDTSQPNGYCTRLGCNTNTCPDNAVCVIFQSSVPGCGYSDYSSPSRTGRSFCEAHCNDDSDCRQSDGYTCQDPRSIPWNGQILDDNQNQRVCMVAAGPLASTMSAPDAAVCSTVLDDAGGATDGGPPGDASGADAANGADAGDAGTADAGDSRESGADATVGDAAVGDATADAGPADATSGD